jgi:hypothetical protein
VVVAASLAAVAAVLCSGEVVFVDTGRPAVLRHVPLGGEGAAIFAAPDGRVVVPLSAGEHTLRVDAAGGVESWPGVLFPLFLGEFDRAYTLLPGLLLTVSYPERLELERRSLPGLGGTYRASASRDGQLVMLIPLAPDRRRLIAVVAASEAPPSEIALAGEASELVMAPSGMWAAVALPPSSVQLVVAGDPHARDPLAVGIRVRCLAAGGDGGDLLVGGESEEGGKLLRYKLARRAAEGLKRRFETRLPAVVTALAATEEEEVLAATAIGVAVLEKGGRRLRAMLPLAGARGVVVLPARLASALPSWSDR